MELPKCLIPLTPYHPYLECQLVAFERFAFSRRLIVGGFGFDKLSDYLASNPAGSRWTLINNTEYRKGNLFSLKAAMSRLTEGFYVFNADHFYSPENYRKIFAVAAERTDSVVAFCDRDRKLIADDMKVVSAAGSLLRMSKTLDSYDCGYVGVTFVPAASLDDYWQAFAVVERQYGDAANVELVLNRLADSGPGVRLHDISGSWWTEIDTPEDLENAQKILKRAGVLE